METVLIKNLAQYVGQIVEISAWIYNLRSSGKISFWQLRDGSGFAQAILNADDLPADQWTEANKATMESAVKITAVVSKHPKQEAYELQVKDFTFYSIAQEYPISKKEHGPDFLLENRHLWLRSPKQWAIMRIRDTLIHATYDWMRQHDFIKIDSPIITASAGENTTDLFEIKYFEDKAYLAQTGQLYIEAAIAAHGRVFDFGPTFRAEKSKTKRHLTEFWMMDAEMAFVDLDDNLKIQEDLVRYLVQTVLEKNQAELAILERDTKVLKNIAQPFHRLTHAAAVKKLNQLGSDIKEDEDLGGDDETLLTTEYDNPIFVTHYPAKIKAFYMERDDSGHAQCADLLAPEGYGEIIGGSQREADYDTLVKQIKEYGLKPEDYDWYLDLRKYGSVPHGGFGLGLERIVTWVCGLQHVREAIPFPRTIYRIKP
ncbi:MAG: Asparagine-tRNA ligase [Candidatus Falkowbacteria bacterium GW2011_GWA2_39_24]|uniref:Asparagine--tRNA ligase n=1 Tax=Candidatus Falkowbacteria bacterium GW2011_GWA2_39_24 TaxID=1618634 RepID=A0A0G0NQ53_9BACT|nr:MAG: Asparagine-tRNA ligase [Candidatus Falkowbacteria bacterium GW2011_GWA2_39_24]